MKTLVSFVLTAAIAASSVSHGLACGAKYFVPGRGASFLLTPAERKGATVMFYAPATSALAQTLARLKSEAALRKAGYQPVVVTTENDLASRAKTTWDIILVSTDDGAMLKRRIPDADQTHLIAIAGNVTKVQLSLARDDYPVVLKSPDHNQDLLDALDQATAHGLSERGKLAKGR